MARISYQKLADKVGVSKDTIREWIAKGHIPYEIDDRGKKYLLEEIALPAVEAYRETRTTPDQSIVKSASETKYVTTSAFNRAKAMREQYNARLAKVKYETQLGELIKREVVEKRVYELGLMIKDAIMAIGGKIAPELASETDEKKILNMINEMHREALSCISEGEFDKWKKKLKKDGMK